MHSTKTIFKNTSTYLHICLIILCFKTSHDCLVFCFAHEIILCFDILFLLRRPGLALCINNNFTIIVNLSEGTVVLSDVTIQLLLLGRIKHLKVFPDLTQMVDIATHKGRHPTLHAVFNDLFEPERNINAMMV